MSFEAMVLDDPDYATGAFDAFVDMSRDYSSWFAESSTRPIIRDAPVSEGRVLGGIIRAQVATEAEWRARIKIVEAKVTEFKALFTAREATCRRRSLRR